MKMILKFQKIISQMTKRKNKKKLLRWIKQIMSLVITKLKIKKMKNKKKNKKK